LLIRAVSASAEEESSFDELDTGNANGTSVGLLESGGAVAGSSVQPEVEDVEMN
jgi:hypothetical protein